MSVSFLAAAGAAAVAAVITAILVGRFARLPRPDQAAWACAAAGLTVALAAQALGYHQGFNAAAFLFTWIWALVKFRFSPLYPSRGDREQR